MKETTPAPAPVETENQIKFSDLNRKQRRKLISILSKQAKKKTK